jgi:hypothetical protein
MLQEQGKSICQTEGREGVLKCNTIRINLGPDFDLSIAQTQIKDGKIVDPKKRYYLAST